MKIKIIIFIIFVLLAIYGALGSGSTSNIDSEQRERLKRAQDKSAIGAPLTKEEKREIESYNKWKNEYDANEYNKKNYGK